MGRYTVKIEPELAVPVVDRLGNEDIFHLEVAFYAYDEVANEAIGPNFDYIGDLHAWVDGLNAVEEYESLGDLVFEPEGGASCATC